jgi:hypothetical protein
MSPGRALFLAGALALASAPSSAASGVPTSVSPPRITGIAQQGEMLSATHGAWTSSPTGYAYQWRQCDASGSGCGSIAGASAQTYVPVAGDVGHTLSVDVTASNSEGASAPASAQPTTPIAALAEWHLEQPEAPPPEPGVERISSTVPLGKIGDIEFARPNLGLLITAGNPPTVPPGVWGYDGVAWRQLTGPGPTKKGICGATDGRIAWAFAGENERGEEEFDFWTISDGRAGQVTEHGAPLEDNSLCHFKGSVNEAGAVVGSYASLALRSDSYQAMRAAGCIKRDDCWFAGNALPSGNQNPGAFHLHWDGSEVHANPDTKGQSHSVQDMRVFELTAPPAEVAGSLQPRYLFESVQRSNANEVGEEELPGSPSLLHLITPIGAQPTFLSLTPGVPVYGETELPSALGFFHLGADEAALWGAGNPVSPGSPEGAEVTIVRETPAGNWSQLLGPNTDPPGGNPFTKFPEPKELREERGNETVTGIAPDHFGESAWLGLTSRENARLESAAPALLARVTASGALAERVSLPTAAEAKAHVQNKGAADKIACPARNDCWLATSTGWLFHLSDGSAHARATRFDQAFSSPINFRPLDAGVPQVLPDAPPPEEAAPTHPPEVGVLAESTSSPSVPVALLSHVRARLIHGTTLELSFHLAAKARVRLVAKRRKRVVAKTAMRTFAAGNRKLTLALNVKQWPTKLDLQTHALEALPTVSLNGAATTTVGTGMIVLPSTPPFSGPRLLR